MVAPIGNLTPEAGDCGSGCNKIKPVSQTVQPIVSKIEANLVVKSGVDRKSSKIPVKKCEDRVEVKNYEGLTSDKVDAMCKVTHDANTFLKEIVDDKCSIAVEHVESTEEKLLDNDIANGKAVMKKESEWSVVESMSSVSEEDVTNEIETAEHNELAAEDNILQNDTVKTKSIDEKESLKGDESEDDMEDTSDHIDELPEENIAENVKSQSKTDKETEITTEEAMKDKEEVEKVSSLYPAMDPSEEWDKLMTQTVRLGMGCLLAYLVVNMWWDYKDGKYFK